MKKNPNCEKIIKIMIFIFLLGGALGGICDHYFFTELNGWELYKPVFKAVVSIAELIYYVLASLAIVFIYLQYTESKKHTTLEEEQKQRMRVEYAHKMFERYAEDILIEEQTIDIGKISNKSSGEVLNRFNKLLNKIDTMAAAFNFNLADSDTGKELFGEAYIDQISEYLVPMQRSYKNHNVKFKNIIQLYSAWGE